MKPHKLYKLLGAAIVILASTGVAHAARSISYDCGQFMGTDAVAPDGYSLTLSPGADTTNGCAGSGSEFDTSYPNEQWMSQGTTTALSSSGTFAPDWEILTTEVPNASGTQSTIFTVEFEYSLGVLTNDPGCATQTASLSFTGGSRSASYSMFDACGGSGDYTFTFNTATGQIAAPTGWNLGTATAAPEIDPSSAVGGLTLLLSGLAILRGARSSSGNAAR
jgi:hypothetical protein